MLRRLQKLLLLQQLLIRLLLPWLLKLLLLQQLLIRLLLLLWRLLELLFWWLQTWLSLLPGGRLPGVVVHWFRVPG